MTKMNWGRARSSYGSEVPSFRDVFEERRRLELATKTLRRRTKKKAQPLSARVSISADCICGHSATLILPSERVRKGVKLCCSQCGRKSKFRRRV
jgi:hypothetical protein